MVDALGNPLPNRLAKIAREQNEAVLSKWLQDACEHWNQGIESILAVHLGTPAPDTPISFVPEPFDEPAPSVPVPKPLGLLGRLFKHQRIRILAENEHAAATHKVALMQWESLKAAHENQQAERKRFIRELRLVDVHSMQEFLAERLADLSWPRETVVSFDIIEDGKAVHVDVDLPEIDDLPKEEASGAARGLRLKIKPRSETKRRREYMRHVHGVVFRVVGEVFAALPSVQRLICSAYSQRPDYSTGNIEDEYLLSLRVTRVQWGTINFANLSLLAPWLASASLTFAAR
ncbi:MAG: hypothetical protein ACRER2_06720 [Methylococcales bacterium]